MDAIAFGYLALAAYPSLAEPKLFTLLSFEFPTLIGFVARMKSLAFQKPLVVSPFIRPTISALIKDVVHNPWTYLDYVWEGFQIKLVPKKEAKTKEQRVAAFWKTLSVMAGLGFFVNFVIQNGIIQFQFEEEEDED